MINHRPSYIPDVDKNKTMLREARYRSNTSLIKLVGMFVIRALVLYVILEALFNHDHEELRREIFEIKTNGAR